MGHYQITWPQRQVPQPQRLRRPQGQPKPHVQLRQRHTRAMAKGAVPKRLDPPEKKWEGNSLCYCFPRTRKTCDPSRSDPMQIDTGCAKVQLTPALLARCLNDWLKNMRTSNHPHYASGNETFPKCFHAENNVDNSGMILHQMLGRQVVGTITSRAHCAKVSELVIVPYDNFLGIGLTRRRA